MLDVCAESAARGASPKLNIEMVSMFNGATPLSCSIYLGSRATTELLLKAGADQKVFNDHGSNQFHDAANNPAMEHSLLDRLNETGVIDVNYQRKPRVRCDAKFSKLK